MHNLFSLNFVILLFAIISLICDILTIFYLFWNYYPFFMRHPYFLFVVPFPYRSFLFFSCCPIDILSFIFITYTFKNMIKQYMFIYFIISLSITGDQTEGLIHTKHMLYYFFTTKLPLWFHCLVTFCIAL